MISSIVIFKNMIMPMMINKLNSQNKLTGSSTIQNTNITIQVPYTIRVIIN